MPAEEDALLAYEEEVERHVLREWLWNVLDDLPEGQRLVVMLRHFGRDRYEEIAEICTMPVGTVRSRVNAARHALAERLLDAATSLDAIDERDERWRSRLAEVLDGVNRASGHPPTCCSRPTPSSRPAGASAVDQPPLREHD